MDLLDRFAADGFEQVVFCHDQRTGLRSVIAIHDTTLGPSLGGVRMHAYAGLDAAVDDCLRLARAMTYKAAAAGVNLGGGKSVIFGDPERDKSEDLLLAHGRHIESLGGRYIPGIDIGTDMDDLRVIGRVASRVSCVIGDPSPMTALGVRSAIRACWQHLEGTPDLTGVRIAVQGMGHVGSALAGLLAEAGAELVVSDVDRQRSAAVAARLGCVEVTPDQILAEPCDVLAPCAMGGVVNDETLDGLKCRVVAGGANNVLDRLDHADGLAQAGILYAPDFVANAGGLILLEEEILGHDEATARARVEEVGAAISRVLQRADQESCSTATAANLIAEERLAAAKAAA